ncbi:MAG TPA: glycosyltransferase family 39 protein, partial [Thermoanaerobaculia bacterium]
SAAAPCLALLALFLAAWSRWLAWQTAATPFPPDAELFRSVASAGGGWYATAREPLFVWILRAFFAALHPSQEAARFASMLIGVAFVGAVYDLGRRLFGTATGLVAAFFLAVHPDLSALSVDGLRDELFALLAALFFRALLPDRGVPGAARTAALAAAAAGIGLTRMNALAAVAVLLVFFAWRRSWRWTRVAVPLVAAVLLLLPYIAYCRARYGDPLYALNVYATGFRNMEFGGQPGFPRREAVARNLFVGPNTTTFGYIFGLHTFGEVLRFMVRGSWRAFLGYWASTPGFFPGATSDAFWFYLAGIPALLFSWRARRIRFRRRGWELALAVAVFFGPVAFLAGVSAFRLDWRIVSFVLIAYAIAAARLFARAIEILEPPRQRREGRSSR